MPSAASVDLDKAPDAPLTARELAEVQGHLAFLRTYRDLLRLKLNAHEDLLVNGSKAPAHRGRIKHLLSKLDRSCVEAALLRGVLKTDKARRASFLGHAAAITGDVAVMLLYLDALVETGEAGHAFGEIVDRMDFSKLSAARLGLLLAAMERAFSPAELPHVLFGLLRGRGFRETFDTHGADLDERLAARFVPLRALQEAIHLRRGLGRDEVQAGLTHLLSTGSNAAHLASLPGRSREGLVRAALSGQQWKSPLVHELALGLSGKASLQKLELARRLVREGSESEALRLLKSMGDQAQAKALAAHLARPRLGPFALTRPEEAGPLRRGWSLRQLREVVLLEGQRWEPVHLPGVADVIEHGQGWLAIEPWGDPLAEALGKASLDKALEVIIAGLRSIRALDLLGKGLPDASPERFLFDGGGSRPTVVLADLRGMREGPTSVVQWVRSGLSWPPFKGRGTRREVSRQKRAWLEEDRDLSQWLEGLVAWRLHQEP